MERSEALRRICEIQGRDLRLLAEEYGVTVQAPNGRTNKGWAGHVVERYLGLALNSSRSPNFGSWELKVVPLRLQRDGTLCVKETMAITMIDPYEVKQKEFEESHVFNKLRKQVVVSRIWESAQERSSRLYGVAEFDLTDPVLYQLVKADYDLIRATICEKGFAALSGKLGVVIQPRTKAQDMAARHEPSMPGHNS